MSLKRTPAIFAWVRLSTTPGSVKRPTPILNCMLCSGSHNLRARLLLRFSATIVNISYLLQSVNCMHHQIVSFLFGREDFSKLIGIPAVLERPHRAKVWRFVCGAQDPHDRICEMCCQKKSSCHHHSSS